ncbi:MAG: GAF domain-containing sensor histidine kinase [Melioribacteraceae bacterium]|nr:GAF domain-containing sensor histidine kinase [Melioribacteraceae bacterium]
MRVASFPPNEKERITNLKSYQILDTDFEEDYDEITKLASFICNTPIAIITLVDSNRQWFKAKVGLTIRETPRDHAFCAHALNKKEELLIVKDTLEDERFVDNPLVLDDPNIRFYAGAPLVTKEGFSLGTICAIDRVPRELSENQLNALKVLSKQVIKLLELKRSNHLLKVKSIELKEVNETKDNFLSIISHDIKNPFFSILGFSEILKTEMDELTKDEKNDLVDKIHSTSKETFKFLETLLKWSLMERGKVDIETTNIDLNEIICKIFSLLSGAAEKKRISLIKDVSPNAEFVADENMILSLFQNLISNSIKFTNIGGKVEIISRIKGDFIEIRVLDSGIGIEKERINNIFELTTKDSTKGTAGEGGTGMGLPLCKQFVRKNGGNIKVESTVGKGTTFTIIFPRVCHI